MTKQENKIPIKGYATFDPLKSCLIGRNFSGDFFKKNITDLKVADPLRRIADETEEDYQALDKILKDAGVKTYRSFLDIDKYGSLKNVIRPPVTPRDYFAVIGEKLYAVAGGGAGFSDVLTQIARKNIVIEKPEYGVISTATVFWPSRRRLFIELAK